MTAEFLQNLFQSVREFFNAINVGDAACQEDGAVKIADPVVAWIEVNSPSSKMRFRFSVERSAANIMIARWVGTVEPDPEIAVDFVRETSNQVVGGFRSKYLKGYKLGLPQNGSDFLFPGARLTCLLARTSVGPMILEVLE